jgi:hypothetical protein
MHAVVPYLHIRNMARLPGASGSPLSARFKGVRMNPLVLALLLSFGPSTGHASPGIGNQNVVRVCSAVSGSCQEFAARALEPAAPAAGQRVFIDPETKTVVQPTRAQLDELSVSIDESLAKRQDTTVETLANGTRRLKSASGFAVDQQAVLHNSEPKRKEKP